MYHKTFHCFHNSHHAIFFSHLYLHEWQNWQKYFSSGEIFRTAIDSLVVVVVVVAKHTLARYFLTNIACYLHVKHQNFPKRLTSWKKHATEKFAKATENQRTTTKKSTTQIVNNNMMMRRTVCALRWITNFTWNESSKILFFFSSFNSFAKCSYEF